MRKIVSLVMILVIITSSILPVNAGDTEQDTESAGNLVEMEVRRLGVVKDTTDHEKTSYLISEDGSEFYSWGSDDNVSGGGIYNDTASTKYASDYRSVSLYTDGTLSTNASNLDYLYKYGEEDPLSTSYFPIDYSDNIYHKLENVAKIDLISYFDHVYLGILQNDGTVSIYSDIEAPYNDMPSEATNIVDLSIGRECIAGVRNNGKIIIWRTPQIQGSIATMNPDDYFEGDTVTDYMVEGIDNAAKISLSDDIYGDRYALALTTSGSAISIGNYGGTHPSVLPDIIDDYEYSDIQAGYDIAAAITTDGKILVWGENDIDYMLDTDIMEKEISKDNYALISPKDNDVTVEEIAVGRNYVLGLLSDDVEIAFGGDNEDGELDVLSKDISLELEGDRNVKLTKGEDYEESGVLAYDGFDRELTVDKSGSIDTSEVGIQKITYSYGDEFINRYVTVYPEDIGFDDMVLGDEGAAVVSPKSDSTGEELSIVGDLPYKDTISNYSGYDINMVVGGYGEDEDYEEYLIINDSDGNYLYYTDTETQLDLMYTPESFFSGGENYGYYTTDGYLLIASQDPYGEFWNNYNTDGTAMEGLGEVGYSSKTYVDFAGYDDDFVVLTSEGHIVGYSSEVNGNSYDSPPDIHSASTLAESEGIRDITLGGMFGAGVKNDGSLFIWRNTSDGEVTTSDIDTVFNNLAEEEQEEIIDLMTDIDNVKVEAGDNHVIVLKEDGTVHGFGRKYSDETELWRDKNGDNVPLGLNTLGNVLDIKAYKNTSMALLNDGTVAIWGEYSPSDISPLENPNTTVELLGDNPLRIMQTDNWSEVDPGMKVSDLVYGESIIYTEFDNTQPTGDYTVTYEYNDKSLTRNIELEAYHNRKIVLNDDSEDTIILRQGGAYTDPGAKVVVEDTEEEDTTITVYATTLDTGILGEQTIKYTATVNGFTIENERAFNIIKDTTLELTSTERYRYDGDEVEDYPIRLIDNYSNEIISESEYDLIVSTSTSSDEDYDVKEIITYSFKASFDSDSDESTSDEIIECEDKLTETVLNLYSLKLNGDSDIQLYGEEVFTDEGVYLYDPVNEETVNEEDYTVETEYYLLVDAEYELRDSATGLDLDSAGQQMIHYTVRYNDGEYEVERLVRINQPVYKAVLEGAEFDYVDFSDIDEYVDQGISSVYDSHSGTVTTDYSVTSDYTSLSLGTNVITYEIIVNAQTLNGELADEQIIYAERTVYVDDGAYTVKLNGDEFITISESEIDEFIDEGIEGIYKNDLSQVTDDYTVLSDFGSFDKGYNVITYTIQLDDQSLVKERKVYVFEDMQPIATEDTIGFVDDGTLKLWNAVGEVDVTFNPDDNIQGNIVKADYSDGNYYLILKDGRVYCTSKYEGGSTDYIDGAFATEDTSLAIKLIRDRNNVIYALYLDGTLEVLYEDDDAYSLKTYSDVKDVVIYELDDNEDQIYVINNDGNVLYTPFNGNDLEQYQSEIDSIVNCEELVVNGTYPAVLYDNDTVEIIGSDLDTSDYNAIRHIYVTGGDSYFLLNEDNELICIEKNSEVEALLEAYEAYQYNFDLEDVRSVAFSYEASTAIIIKNDRSVTWYGSGIEVADEYNDKFIFELVGSEQIVVEYGVAFDDPGFIFENAFEGELDQSLVVVTGAPEDETDNGIHIITYEVTYRDVDYTLTRYVFVVSDISIIEGDGYYARINGDNTVTIYGDLMTPEFDDVIKIVPNNDSMYLLRDNGDVYKVNQTEATKLDQFENMIDIYVDWNDTIFGVDENGDIIGKSQFYPYYIWANFYYEEYTNVGDIDTYLMTSEYIYQDMECEVGKIIQAEENYILTIDGEVYRIGYGYGTTGIVYYKVSSDIKMISVYADVEGNYITEQVIMITDNDDIYQAEYTVKNLFTQGYSGSTIFSTDMFYDSAEIINTEFGIDKEVDKVISVKANQDRYYVRLDSGNILQYSNGVDRELPYDWEFSEFSYKLDDVAYATETDSSPLLEIEGGHEGYTVKYAKGEQVLSYFKTSGEEISNNYQFEDLETGKHTIYIMDKERNTKVIVFEVK